MENQAELRTKLLKRLVDIGRDYDAWWTSPKGKACQITMAGLWIPELNGSIPWGDVKLSDLMTILRDSEKDIHKAPFIGGKEAGVLWPRFNPRPVDPKNPKRKPMERPRVAKVEIVEAVPPMPVEEPPFAPPVEEGW